jgi:dihydrofolate reductase
MTLALTPALSAIVAMSVPGRVIGRDGALPWHFPEDLAFFKSTTMGHPVLMGRATYESIGRPLPGRLNLVLSTKMDPVPGVTVIRSLDELPSAAAGHARVFVIGGARLFAALLPRCTEVFLTRVHQEVEGDVHMPAFEHLFPPPEVLRASPPLEFLRYQAAPDSP